MVSGEDGISCITDINRTEALNTVDEKRLSIELEHIRNECDTTLHKMADRFNSEISGKNSEISSLRNMIDELSSRLEDKIRDNNNLIDSNDRLVIANSELTMINKKLENEIRNNAGRHDSTERSGLFSPSPNPGIMNTRTDNSAIIRNNVTMYDGTVMSNGRRIPGRKYISTNGYESWN